MRCFLCAHRPALYILVFLCATGAAYLFSLFFCRLAPKIGFLDRPDARKLHKRPMPLMGGAAIFMGFWAAVFPFIGAPRVVKILFCGSLSVSLLGLWDDKFNLRPMQKLFFQAVIAILTVSSGIRITLFLPHPAGSILSVFWILLIVNAFNLLDNTDGASAGVALTACLVLFFSTLVMKNFFMAGILAAFAGSTLGFLFLNFPPAKIFMGDCGSMFIGYIVSVVSILGTYYRQGAPTLFAVLIPILALAVPLFDTFSVICIRGAKGIPLFQADKNHFSHRLMNLGMSRRAAVLFLCLVTFCVGLPGVLLHLLPPSGVVVVFLQAAAVLSIIAVLEYYGNGRR